MQTASGNLSAENGDSLGKNNALAAIGEPGSGYLKLGAGTGRFRSSMYSRALLAYLVPRRRRLSNGLVLVSRARDYFLELLVVVALVAGLSGLALASYRPAVAKAALVEAMILMRGLQTGVLVELAETGELPQTLETTDTLKARPGRAYQSLSWTDQEIVLQLSPETVEERNLVADEARSEPMYLSFRIAATEQGRLLVLCGQAQAPAGFSGPASQYTNVPDKYLPQPCRN